MRKHLNRCLCIVRCVKSKAPGRDESLPYNANRKKGFGASLRAGHARPLQDSLLSLPAFAGGCKRNNRCTRLFFIGASSKGRTNKKIPHRPEQRTMRAKRNKQTAKKAQSKTPKRRRSLLLAGTAPERQTAG